MIFAAGRGTRLGALGESTPKALLEIGGRTLLEHAVASLRQAGARRIVVNVHHHADRIERFLAAHDLGAEIRVSREDDRPLETGGGLWHARARFHAGEEILMQNVDVLSTLHLRPLVAAQHGSDRVATLAVHRRETARQLLFDEIGLFGREDRRDGSRREVRPPRGPVRALAFAGIHCGSPRLPGLITERGVFPIMDVYLRLAAAGHVVAPWLTERGAWLEVGTLDRLEAVRALVTKLAEDPRDPEAIRAAQERLEGLGVLPAAAEPERDPGAPGGPAA
jgi:NDP-sugar pyrophosphorylase family protein